MSGKALSHGTGLKMGQSLVGHFLSFCSIFVPAYLEEGQILSQRFLWMGCVLSSPLEVLPGYRTLYPPLLEALARVTLIDCLDSSLSEVSGMSYK